MNDQQTLENLPELLYVAFYRDGSGNESKDEWKMNEEGINEEIERYRRVGYNWTKPATLSKESIITSAKELDMSVSNFTHLM